MCLPSSVLSRVVPDTGHVTFDVQTAYDIQTANVSQKGSQTIGNPVISDHVPCLINQTTLKTTITKTRKKHQRKYVSTYVCQNIRISITYIYIHTYIHVLQEFTTGIKQRQYAAGLREYQNQETFICQGNGEIGPTGYVRFQLQFIQFQA